MLGDESKNRYQAFCGYIRFKSSAQCSTSQTNEPILIKFIYVGISYFNNISEYFKKISDISKCRRICIKNKKYNFLNFGSNDFDQIWLKRSPELHKQNVLGVTLQKISVHKLSDVIKESAKEHLKDVFFKNYSSYFGEMWSLIYRTNVENCKW